MILSRIDSPSSMVGELGEAFEFCRHLKGEELINKSYQILEDL